MVGAGRVAINKRDLFLPTLSLQLVPPIDQTQPEASGPGPLVLHL